ncbi:hypothetical protein KCP75_17405 [Salmonella enterica subsp. enterica]|nr:hypothetical protein KCP75_17405 [Salmonella enterica subsp. enterica]
MLTPFWLTADGDSRSRPARATHSARYGRQRRWRNHNTTFRPLRLSSFGKVRFTRELNMASGGVDDAAGFTQLGGLRELIFHFSFDGFFHRQAVSYRR